jgi:hypothetical protein
MSENIIISFISFVGTAIGAFGGIIASSKLTNFRLKKLEEKVDKHNQIIERTYKLEEKVKSVNHRISDLERRVEVWK